MIYIDSFNDQLHIYWLNWLVKFIYKSRPTEGGRLQGTSHYPCGQLIEENINGMNIW